MRGVVVAVALGLALSLSACGGANREERLTVLAAASLTEPFSELARRLEARHDGVEVVMSFDSSATIATQVGSGLAADVVATADPRTMQMMVDAGALAGEPVVFARNGLALVVPPGNPARVDGIEDLQRVDFVACAVAAPCGALAAELLADAGVSNQPRSLEVDVKAVLTKVMLDEADAGLVYASDVVAAGRRVTEVDLGPAGRLSTSYPVAVTADSAEPGLAEEFVALLLSEEGQRVLAGAGFGAAEQGRTP